MKTSIKYLIAAALFFTVIISKAQETYIRTVGLTTSIQEGDIGIQLPIWIVKNVTLAPYISLKSVSNTENDYVLGIIPKFYISIEKLAPYIGFKLGAAISAPSDNTSNKSTTDIIGGVAFGGDYFFDPRFSLGVEAQINFASSDENSSRFGNPGGTNINTGMAVNASIFFGK